MNYAITILKDRMDFLKLRLSYARHKKDELLMEKVQDKIAELEKAVEILKQELIPS
jgi:hypothetical protein